MQDGNRKKAAAAILAVAVVAQMLADSPQPDGGLVLKFVGPTAAQDRSVVRHLAGEIADVIEWDGKLDKPRMTAGVHFDDLRTQAREFRCRGERIGSRQQAVNEAVHKYLLEQLGDSGGPVTPEQRQKWVDCYREIERAAGDAR